ncbi:hypothetical protein [Vibrio nomapromontoriensis]
MYMLVFGGTFLLQSQPITLETEAKRLVKMPRVGSRLKALVIFFSAT